MVSRRQIDAAKPELVLGLIESWRTTAVDLETCADDYMRVMERPAADKPGRGKRLKQRSPRPTPTACKSFAVRMRSTGWQTGPIAA